MAPRKSARASKQAPAADNAGWDPNEAVGAGAVEDEDEDFEPPAKKAKTKSKATSSSSTTGKAAKGKGRKKKLEVFNTMPLDVLALIMAQLDTKTLLAMSRTCSTFRNLLHSQQGTSIWKTGRQNTQQIPDLKAGDLKEWEYASLLFDSTCHICHKDRAKTTDWTLRARACADCMRGNSKRREKMTGEGRFHAKVWECVPESHWTPGYGGEVYCFFWLPTLRQVSARLDELAGKPEYNDFLAKRQKIHNLAREDARQIERWEQRYRMHKDDDKEEAKASRKRKIKEKLRDLGYTEEELSSYALENSKEFDQARDLSDAIWKRIKPILTGLLDGERAEAARRAAATAMRGRANTLKPWYESLQASIPSGDERSLFPPWANFLVLPSVRALYEPEDAAPTQNDLNLKRSVVVEEGRRFGLEIKMAFFAKLAQAHAEAAKLASGSSQAVGVYASAAIISGASVDALAKLVTSAVPCPSWSCQTVSTFPAILDHFKVCGLNPLTDTSLVTTPERILAMRHLLSVVNAVEPGKVSEARTSTADLHALGKAFKCQDCAASVAAVGVATWSAVYSSNLTWSQMASHLLNVHTKPATGFVPPELVYTPPEPLAPGPENPGGFVVEEV
ncbi:hypothetical protein JCM6882_003186 [Rhodosporidiobolus microsporus]